jgi:hypothetical protein
VDLWILGAACICVVGSKQSRLATFNAGGILVCLGSY